MSDARRRRELALPRFSLERRITVLVLLATVFVVGLIATLGTPLELLPRGIDHAMLSVQGQWRDAPAQEMLDKVALPLEEELATVPGVENLYTFAGTGFTRVRVTFESGADLDVAYREVRDRVERAKARMPEEVDRVQIRKADESQIPVFAFGIVADPELVDAYSLIQTHIVQRLQRVEGVALVNVQGLVEKEVLIELDREATEAAGLNVFELAQDLANDNFTLASGHVDAGGRKLLLRSVAKYEDLDALRARPLPRPRRTTDRRVAANPEPATDTIRLDKVATIRYAEPDDLFRARANSKPAFFALVLKESEANALEVSSRIAAVVDAMQDDPRLALFGIDVFFNQGETILESLGILLDSGKIGAVIAAFVLFFFLRRVRMTMIIALSIPLSLLLALITMYFAGETLNIISLLGLMISVGLLVDNSVVVAENIFRLHQEGVPRREAAIRGAGEISLAIIMATLTTVIVFLPVSLVEGQGQFFLLRLAIPITASLAGSLLVALVFVPLAAYLTLPSVGSSAGADGARWGLASRARRAATRLGARLRPALRAAYEQTFGRLQRLYLRLLALSLRRRLDLAVAVSAVAALTAWLPMQQVDVGAVQEDERGGFEIDVSLPLSTTFEEAAEHFDRVEKILEENKDAWELRTYLIIHRPTWGEIQGWFEPQREGRITARELTETLIERMPERGGIKIYTGLEGDDEEDKKDLHVLTLIGEDAVELERVGDELEAAFLEIDGVLGIRRAGDEPSEEMALAVDRDRAQRLGVNPASIAGVVRNSLGGRMLPKFYRDGREIPVRVRFAEEDRESLSQLQDFRVPTASGETVALSSVTAPRRLDTPGRISRTNKQLSRSLTVELEEGKEKETRRRLEAFAARVDLPEGLRFGNPRRGGGIDEDTKSLVFAMLLSVVFIYLLMGFLFESFVLPLSIVSTIPLAVLGVYWGHWIAGLDLDALGMVGIVLLIGVVVNNGIVLVDAVNRVRADGLERRRAVLVAAERRFRPILMTALTTIAGMVPLLLGEQSAIGISYRSFGVTLIGGMAVATLLTLLVVPVAYTLFDDLASSLLRLVARAAGTPRSGGRARREGPGKTASEGLVGSRS